MDYRLIKITSYPKLFEESAMDYPAKEEIRHLLQQNFRADKNFLKLLCEFLSTTQ